jgi:Mce-associated membrane protein
VTTNDTGDVADADETETVADETSDVTTDEATDSDDEATDSDAESERGDGSVRRKGRIVGAIVLAAALVASAGVTAWLYFKQYRPDQETNPASAAVALDAAKTGTIALLSYSPESLEKDFAAAKSRLTGDFLSYYTQFTEQIVTPAAKQKSVKTSATVVQAAVSDIKPETAEVLVFINQTTVSKENPDGSFAASAVKVGLKKVNGAWLIESFDPV